MVPHVSLKSKLCVEQCGNFELLHVFCEVVFVECLGRNGEE